MIAVHTHCTITMRTMKRAACGINRNQVVINPQTITLRVTIGKKPPLQHFIWRKTNTGRHIGRVKGGLLDFSVVVFRVAVELQDTNINQRVILMWPNFGQVKGMVGNLRGIGFRHNLHAHLPFRKITALNGFI